MKFSLNVGQYYSNVDLKTLSRNEIIQKMGLQLGAIEDVIDWGAKYQGIVVVRVVEFKKHPNADKLSVCRIDDGGVTQNVDRDEEGYIQVVCGAPNVKSGIHVAWIPPGATVPSTVASDPFVLEARELRGEVSNGMLASPRELEISDEHEGILIIDEKEVGRKPKVGEPITLFYGLDDLIIDCENKMFTHRPDCFGNLGIARELAGIYGLKFISPDWYLEKPEFVEASHVNINSQNPIPELVPRFSVVAMNNVTIKNSPVWMQSYLKRVGIKPINNIVDVTNFIMHLTGQPIHAFDLDKLLGKSKSNSADNVSIYPRKAEKGEELLLLGNKKVKLDENDIVISTDEQAVALAGVMGGAETEVDENTKSIVIECANFDMYSVRRTSMRHGLFTDAVSRFNKGQSPLQNDRVLAYAMKIISEVSGATQASNVVDVTSFDLSNDNLNHVQTSIDFINSRLGTKLKPEEVKNLLENVEFDVALQGPTLKITAPFWRMDISIAEDIVEEVGRLYGYDKIPVVLPARISAPTPKNPIREFKNEIRSKLSTLGANEVLTYSFVNGDLLDKSNIEADKWAYHLRNALSPDLQYYRPVLLASLLSKVHPNIKANAGDENNHFALFEIGKVHIKGVAEKEEINLPKEFNRLGFVIAADEKSLTNVNNSAYYHAKKYLDELTNNQATYIQLEDFSKPITAMYKKGRSASVALNGETLGVIGEFMNKTTKKLKLPEFCAGFEIDVDVLRDFVGKDSYRPLSGFPSSKQDVTFEVTEDTSWFELSSFVSAELAVAAAKDNLNIEIKPLAIYKQDNSNKKRISFRIELVSLQKTLKTDEVNKILDHISEAAHEKLKAIRI